MITLTVVYNRHTDHVTHVIHCIVNKYKKAAVLIGTEIREVWLGTVTLKQSDDL